MDAAAGVLPVARFVPLAEFTRFKYQVAEPLLGTASECVIPVGGMVVFYGDGGAGKTTLILDAVFHLASGMEWLGLEVPRQVQVTIIENDGPLGMFAFKVDAKHTWWRTQHGNVLGDHISVAAAPWGAWSLDDDHLQKQLAGHLTKHRTDLLVCGPVASLGIKGGGTPEEINDFTALLRQVCERVDHLVATCLLHHENRAGQVSGAWERVPDTLVHVQAQGHGHTRVFWQKARWCSMLHKTTTHLEWTDGEGFAIVEPEPPVAPERVREETEAYVLANGGSSQKAVVDNVSGNHALRERTVKALLVEGVLVNLGTEHRFKLWHRDDPALPTTLDVATFPTHGEADGEGRFQSREAGV
jgi:hypothetical protein